MVLQCATWGKYGRYLLLRVFTGSLYTLQSGLCTPLCISSTVHIYALSTDLFCTTYSMGIHIVTDVTTIYSFNTIVSHMEHSCMACAPLSTVYKKACIVDRILSLSIRKALT